MRRVQRLVLILAGLALVTPAMAVLPLRWVDPPLSAFMLETHRRIQARQHIDGPTIYYRWVDLETIAPAMALAAVAAEDQTFPNHHGFVWGQIDKALEHNLDGGRVRGASSISQQVAKNLFLWPAKSYVRKGIEAYFTVWIELLWPKRRILEVYLNIAQFDNRIFGVGAAAPHLFGVPPGRLTRAQAALLAAVLPAPRRADAEAPSAYIRRRQDWILQQMDQLGDGYLAAILHQGTGG